MRSWIRNLRYTKAYWSMKDYRETVTDCTGPGEDD